MTIAGLTAESLTQPAGLSEGPCFQDRHYDSAKSCQGRVVETTMATVHASAQNSLTNAFFRPAARHLLLRKIRRLFS